MSFQGIALFALGAISFAYSLYYLYTYGVTYEQQGTSGGNSRNTNDYDPRVCREFNPWYEPTDRERKRRSKKSEKRKRLGSNCTICLSGTVISDHETILPCLHSFHSKCIEDWRLYGPTESRYTCPNCRKSYSQNHN